MINNHDQTIVYIGTGHLAGGKVTGTATGASAVPPTTFTLISILANMSPSVRGTGTARIEVVGGVAPGVVHRLVPGAAAGAAGTTALNAATYRDMVVRARPPSTTPERTVDRLAGVIHARIPVARSSAATGAPAWVR